MEATFQIPTNDKVRCHISFCHDVTFVVSNVVLYQGLNNIPSLVEIDWIVSKLQIFTDSKYMGATAFLLKQSHVYVIDVFLIVVTTFPLHLAIICQIVKK